MKTISIIQPDEFGSDFSFDQGVWNVRFPPGKPNIDPASKDAGNAITEGTDGGAYLSEALLCAYAIVQDNVTRKIHLYQYPVGTTFNVATATLVSTVNMVELQAVFDDVAIDGSVITFTDADTGASMTIDTDTLQRIDGITSATAAITLSTVNGETTPSIEVAEYINDAPNLLTVTPNGLLADGDMIADEIANVLGDSNLNANIYRYDEELNVIRHNVAGNELSIPQIKILNSKGDLVGLIDDLEQGVVTFSVATPLDYSPFV